MLGKRYARACLWVNKEGADRPHNAVPLQTESYEIGDAPAAHRFENAARPRWADSQPANSVSLVFAHGGVRAGVYEGPYYAPAKLCSRRRSALSDGRA
jgi:hypothetical protein